MDTLLAARLQMTFALAFHMIFASLGVGMPLLMLLAETGWVKRKEEVYLQLTERWAKVVGVLFAIGAVSGTVLSLSLGLLWPNFMELAGPAIGPAFTLEAFAFFIEAIFLGIYLYGWKRLSPQAHWLAGMPLAVASAASSFLVTSANAWMQNPVGIEQLQSGTGNLNLTAALFANPYWPLMAIHSTIACYATTAFMVAGVYAWGLLKGKRDELHQAALKLALAVGVVASVLMPLTGHASAALVVTKYQPAKLAAMEALFTTQKGAPLLIGGIPDVEEGTVKYALEIPYGLSILAYTNPNAEVMGLDQVPRSDWPNVALTHYSFQVMVGAGMLILLGSLWFWWAWRRTRNGVFANTPLMRTLVAISPFGLIALETGWIVTEVGRQPWIVYGVMRTSAGVTPVAWVLGSLIGVVLIYVVLSATLVSLLRYLSRKNSQNSSQSFPTPAEKLA